MTQYACPTAGKQQTLRKTQSEGNSYSLKKGKWRAATLVTG